MASTWCLYRGSVWPAEEAVFPKRKISAHCGLSCPASHSDSTLPPELKVRVDLDEGFRPILLRCVLCIHKGADVVCLDACEAACELSVLVDQCLAKFKNVQKQSHTVLCADESAWRCLRGDYGTENPFFRPKRPVARWCYAPGCIHLWRVGTAVRSCRQPQVGGG